MNKGKGQLEDQAAALPASAWLSDHVEAHQAAAVQPPPAGLSAQPMLSYRDALRHSPVEYQLLTQPRHQQTLCLLSHHVQHTAAMSTWADMPQPRRRAIEPARPSLPPSHCRSRLQSVPVPAMMPAWPDDTGHRAVVPRLRPAQLLHHSANSSV